MYRCRVCGAFTEEPQHCGEPAALLMTSEQRLRLSKLMSALLRHIPWEAGIELDPEGWVGVDELVKGITERWRNKHLYRWVTRDHVIAVALLDPKGRFQLSPDMSRIRASYGHSVRVSVRYQEARNPPPTLYHATPVENLRSIMREGLKPMRRLYVHLALRQDDALEAGFRHGSKVALLAVDTRCLRERGVGVLVASSRVYLARWVPPDCIRVLRVEERRQSGRG